MAASPDPASIVCLGEGLVDLIGPDPGAGEPADLEVHFGGALANVAVTAARAGAPVALASGCGRDRWGGFLLSRLRREGVDLRFYSELDGAPTAYAFAFLDPGGEPTFEIHGEGIDAAIASLSGREEEIADAATAVVVGSNTMVSARSREITEAMVAAAMERGVSVLVDPNLRPGRWSDLDEARSVCMPLVRSADVLKCNADEARWLLADDGATGAEAAGALCELGPRLVIVTSGTGPVVARGAAAADVTPPKVEVVSPLGAGDAFMGTLAAGLHARDFDLALAGEVLSAAAEVAARTCTHLGAFER